MLTLERPRLLAGSVASFTNRGTFRINNPSHASGIYNLSGRAVNGTTETIFSMGEETKDRNIMVIGAVGALLTVLSVHWCGQNIPVRYSVSGSTSGVFVASGRAPKSVIGPLSVRFSVGLFSLCNGMVFTGTGMISDEPLTATSQIQTAALAGTADLITKDGGIILGVASNDITAAQNCTWTGDQSPVEIVEASDSGRITMASISNTVDDAANTITSTFDVISTVRNVLVAASFR